MLQAGVARGFTVTSLRSVTITKQNKIGANATAVDRFTHHSDVASTVRQYYNKNNNNKVRALIAEVKEESAGESESEIEADEELRLADHTPGTVGLSPKEEFSPIVTFFQRQQFTAQYYQTQLTQQRVLSTYRVQQTKGELTLSGGGDA
ncbi:MAG: hypothetical protein EZS28_010986 [Streblomastix strix]|uniref:Tyr recombinase domain-containing protein n=1 Tax=Streblomastix strix TaxID=222440 RepID=A0A5J4WFT1_9EUKA|nr:MAG: hypothetical protein EZS28_010986 [Streblomastix strix]